MFGISNLESNGRGLNGLGGLGWNMKKRLSWIAASMLRFWRFFHFVINLKLAFEPNEYVAHTFKTAYFLKRPIT
ncbi:hypothetical protein Z947_420 [Sulfitobacter geojensis]|nr:hypothetical protein Z947_420 [Sulfitobacter geojensis]